MRGFEVAQFRGLTLAKYSHTKLIMTGRDKGRRGSTWSPAIPSGLILDRWFKAEAVKYILSTS